MSSVRNRIMQFQQNSSNGTGNASLGSTAGLKSSFARNGSNGSIPPDIVAATGSSIGRNQFALSNNNNIHNSSVSSSGIGRSGNQNKTACSTFPYSTSQKQPLNHSNQQQLQNSNNCSNDYFGNTYGLKTTTLPAQVAMTTSPNQSQLNTRKFSGNFSDNTSLASTWRSSAGAGNSACETNGPASDKRSLISEPGGVIRTVEIPLKSSSTLGNTSEQTGFVHQTPPVVNRTNKPSLAMKKASMTINLASTPSPSASAASSPSPIGISNGVDTNTNGNGSIGYSNRGLPSPTRAKARTPTRTNPSSSIPKLNSSNSSGSGFGNGNTSTVGAVRYRDPSPGGIGRRSPATSNRATPATTPTGNSNGVAFGSSFGSSTNRLYQSIGWKEKFEESEKKRTNLVNLAQKATRDYEELRRRYHELYTDHEKTVTRYDAANGQLESLRKASEATYEEYYKLKKRYEAENKGKSDALNRVDEYNKENRRLKRQSALMMQQIDPTTLLANANLFDSVSEADSSESDKEIQYLRKHVKELETKIIELETELERIRLSEFESQEAVLLTNDSIQSSKSENKRLREDLRKLDEDNRKLARSLEDITFEHDTLMCKQAVDEEKLLVAETELKKLLNEKNILQRQSLVFMNNEEMDGKLLEALAQIGDLQTAMEDQKNALESQIIELKNRLSEKELEEETAEIQHNAKTKALEEEIKSLRSRAEEAERNLEDCATTQSVAPPPPPPPPPPMGGPPPPPPPPISIMNSGGGLGSSLQSAMGTLRKGPRNLDSDTPPNGLCESQGKSLVTASPQIDGIVSQIKQGIKLRPTDRTLLRKQTETEKPLASNAVEEMRSILDNMRRNREQEKRF